MTCPFFASFFNLLHQFSESSCHCHYFGLRTQSTARKPPQPNPLIYFSFCNSNQERKTNTQTLALFVLHSPFPSHQPSKGKTSNHKEQERERMGDDMYNNYDKTLSSSSSSQDEISLFLRQILLRSSSSAASSSQTHNNSMPLENAHPSSSSFPLSSSPLHDGKISAQLGSTAGATPGFLSALGAYGSMKGHGGSAANVSSSSVGVSENDTDDYDCESEEGVEALAEEVPTKSVPCRGSSKRSRAAEVHNLSEKRRRSRINEKMKALQNLIPNSNKTDKASMLDEAIEYLKQLQLQVQMLSMRNGLSLHPMCFPEGLQSLQLSRMSMELSEENRAIPLSMRDALPLHQGNPLHYAPNLPNKPTMPNQPPVTYPSYLNNSETSFGLESPILAHIKPLQPGRSSEARREDILQHQQSNTSHSDTNPLGCPQAVKEEPGTLATASLSFDMQTTEAKDNSSLQTCIAGRDQSAGIMRNS